jgi:deoxyribose-phosphate aldolase
MLKAALEHTNLKPDATSADIVRTCREAIENGLGAVVVNPVWVSTAREALDGSAVQLVTVSGFPLGASRTEFKVVEAVRGAIDGAQEIDLVANIGWIRGGEIGRAHQEIREVRRALPEPVILKVIIEATLLSAAQIGEAVEICVEGGAQFVKTSTGFYGGATVEMVSALSSLAEGRVKIKAAGGIKTAGQCYDLLRAGATRIGSSSSLAILSSDAR